MNRFRFTLSWPLLSHLAILICLLIWSLAVWWPTRFLPFHWDSAGFVHQAAQNLSATNFSPLIADGSDFAHPPLVPLLLAWVRISFPPDLLNAHLLVLPLLPLFLISAYWFGYKLSGPLGGVALAFLLGFTPVVLAESGIIYLDLPVAAFSLTALTLWLYRRPWLSLGFFFLALATKETALLLLPFYFFYGFNGWSRRRLVLYCLVPIFVMFGWFAYHASVTTWWFIAPTAQFGHRFTQNLTELLNVTVKILRVSGLDQARFLISLPLIIILYRSALDYRQFKPSDRRLFNSLLSVMLSFGLFYLVISEYTPRYLILILPYLYFLVIWGLSRWFAKLTPNFHLWLLSGYTALTSLAFIYFWRPTSPLLTRYDFRPPSDLRYQNQIAVFRQAAAQLTVQAPNLVVYGSFPENIYFTEPLLGYISKPLTFRPCLETTINAKPPVIIVVHPFSPGQQLCRRLVSAANLKPFAHFTSADQWLELYQFNATAAAVLPTL